MRGSSVSESTHSESRVACPSPTRYTSIWIQSPSTVATRSPTWLTSRAHSGTSYEPELGVFTSGSSLASGAAMSLGPSGSSAFGDSSGAGSLVACCCDGRTFGSNPEAASAPQAESVRADARATPAKINGRDLVFTISKTPHEECHKKHLKD